MADSPSALSVGIRCLDQGFWFLWVPFMVPCWVIPNLIIVPCTLRKRCPYLMDDLRDVVPRDRTEIARITGVSIVRGQVRLSMPCVDACPNVDEKEEKVDSDVNASGGSSMGSGDAKVKLEIEEAKDKDVFNDECLEVDPVKHLEILGRIRSNLFYYATLESLYYELF